MQVKKQSLFENLNPLKISFRKYLSVWPALVIVVGAVGNTSYAMDPEPSIASTTASVEDSSASTSSGDGSWHWNDGFWDWNGEAIPLSGLAISAPQLSFRFRTIEGDDHLGQMEVDLGTSSRAH